jgi:aspartyl-tRNA(Asn)/glutamyl-tRNA(Gln) amidotransferase subunit A
MLSVIAGYDELDVSTVNAPSADYSRAIQMRTSKLRLGIPRTPFFENLEPEVAKAVDAALDVLRHLAGEVKDVQVPASAGMTGVSNAEIYAFHAPYITKSPELYQDATRRIVLGGANAKSEQYVDGLRRVELARREITKSFVSVDLLITPTTGGTATLIPRQQVTASGRRRTVGRRRRWRGRRSGRLPHTSYFSVYGLPAISIPCGFTSSGLPIGLQISGAPFAESNVLALAHAYEQATEWHKRRPRLSV